MMSNEGYRDRVLVCRDCNQEFTFTAGEQEFFASKGLTNTPSRCPSCRAARRGGASSSQSRTLRAPRGESYETICANCGRPTTVPFVPSEGRAVYCSDCFQAQRSSRPRREYYASNYGSSGGYESGNNYGYNDSFRGGDNYSSGSREDRNGGRNRGHRRDNDRSRRDNDRRNDNW